MDVLYIQCIISNMSFYRKTRKLLLKPNLFFIDYVKKRAIDNKTIKQLNVQKDINQFPSIKKPSYQFDNNYDAYIYMPWIANHGDKLIEKINISDNYKIYPLDMFENWGEETRKKVSKLSRNDAAAYRTIILQHLIPIRNQIKGVIFTFDWHPVMRILSKVCEELKIKRILIPHESVFMDEAKYYWHEESNIKMPIADNILCWGALQKRIFLERGVKPEKVQAVGAPKFDLHKNYKNKLERDLFFQIYGLNPNKKTILVALQPMDIQVDQSLGKKKQNTMILDLLNFSEKHDIQLILREPPTKINVIFMDARHKIQENNNVYIDKFGQALSTAEEAIFHTDAVVSINSTMLFEALLMDKIAVSAKYIQFEQIWNNIGIPYATNAKYLDILLEKYLINHYPFTVSPEGWSWAKENLSSGDFDGNAAKRIKDFLEKKSFDDKLSNNLFETKSEKIAISNDAILQDTGKYLPTLLNTHHIYTPKNIQKASYADHFIQWGNAKTKSKARLQKKMQMFGKKAFILEDGFIRSLGIGLSGEATLSISLCGDTAYYDAYGVSNFEKSLNSGRIFTLNEIDKAKKAIQLIIDHKVSKYNNSPYLPIKIGDPNKKKTLLVDQRLGDQSIASAMADETTFKDMLIDAIRDNPDHDIIIKRHPDAIKGGKGSCFNDDVINFTRNISNVHIIDYDIHPHQLINMSDKIYVVSSGLGIEALFYGKEVYCYGVPFYSNWGITHDKIKLKRRIQKRSIEEIFYVSYIEYARYYSPDNKNICDIEECISYILRKRKIKIL